MGDGVLRRAMILLVAAALGDGVLRYAMIFLVAAALCGGTAAADKLSELQARFDAETNGVHKAKLLQRLGDAEFDEAVRAEKAGDFTTVGLLMEKYRDNVAVASAALQKGNPDGEHHPAGYKQLEMHVQKGLRELDEYILEAPDAYKPPLELVRTDLTSLDDKLLRILFPTHRPAKPAESAPPPLGLVAQVYRKREPTLYEELNAMAAEPLCSRCRYVPV